MLISLLASCSSEEVWETRRLQLIEVSWHEDAIFCWDLDVELLVKIYLPTKIFPYPKEKIRELSKDRPIERALYHKGTYYGGAL